MTTQAQNKKTVRHFQCRDYLWEIFEQMSAELECSTDYLINEAMRQYARSRNYGTNRSEQEQVTNPPPVRASTQGEPSQTSIPSLKTPAINRPGFPASPTPSVGRPLNSGIPKIDVAQRVGSGIAKGPSVPPPPPPSSRSSQRIQSQTSSVPPPLPGSKIEVPLAAQSQRPRLYIIFNGQKIPVNKEEFVIGRSAKAADLPIKDGNISRRHAAVVFQRGYYYLKDLGSTNGVEFQGRQFDTKRIDEGDIFRLCDYELQFTYQ